MLTVMEERRKRLGGKCADCDEEERKGQHVSKPVPFNSFVCDDKRCDRVGQDTCANGYCHGKTIRNLETVK